MILEQLMTGTVIGSLPGLPGNGPHQLPHPARLRIAEGLISRENVWLNSAAIVDQLSRR
jgi:hypothetical protein